VRERHAATALFVSLLLILAGCGATKDYSAPSTMPADTTPPAPTLPPPTTDPAAVGAVQQYFLRDGVLAAGEARLVPGPDLAARALDVLVAGPTDADRAAGLTTGISPRVVVNSFTIDANNVTVDFNRAFETADTQPQVAQVVHTLTQFSDIDTVTFLIDGQPNGATGVKPIARSGVRRDLAPPG
jgi:hypothetical protein